MKYSLSVERKDESKRLGRMTMSNERGWAEIEVKRQAIDTVPPLSHTGSTERTMATLESGSRQDKLIARGSGNSSNSR